LSCQTIWFSSSNKLKHALSFLARRAVSFRKVRMETSNRSIFVPLPDGLTLKSDTDYDWSVAITLDTGVGNANGVGGDVRSGLKLNASSSFSTGLLANGDWEGSSMWLAASSSAAMPAGCSGCAVAAQLRKVRKSLRLTVLVVRNNDCLLRQAQNEQDGECNEAWVLCRNSRCPLAT
jgi:hypothetical protein